MDVYKLKLAEIFDTTDYSKFFKMIDTLKNLENLAKLNTDEKNDFLNYVQKEYPNLFELAKTMVSILPYFEK